MDDDLGTFPDRGAASRIADDRLTDSRDRVLRGCCKLAFGVGTHLTNDLGPTQLSIVIKMVRCNGPPVAKRSDSPGKSMCDAPGYLTYLRQVCGIRANAAA